MATTWEYATIPLIIHATKAILDQSNTSSPWRPARLRLRIAGSTLAPWHDIDALPDGLDAARPVAVLCGSGQRAAVAASLLQRYGAEHVIHVVEGGVPKWGRLGHRLERSQTPASASA